jgi:hypothetical protein
MKRWIFPLIIGCLLVSFQNCARTAVDSTTGQIQTMSENSVSTLNPSDAQTVEVPNSATVDSQVSKVSAKASSDSLFSSYNLSIHPKTGIVDVLEADGSVSPDTQFCLRSAQIAQLEDLLTQAKLCEAQDQSHGDVACSMDYHSPYAKLHFSDRDVVLGERYSGCNKGPDLCGAQSTQMQAFLKNVTDNLASLTCHFQAL